MMKGVPYLVTVAILALAFSFASAYDPSPLQDFCVAINNTDSAGMYMHALSLLLAVHSSIIICIVFYFIFFLHDMLFSIVTELSYL